MGTTILSPTIGRATRTPTYVFSAFVIRDQHEFDSSISRGTRRLQSSHTHPFIRTVGVGISSLKSEGRELTER